MMCNGVFAIGKCPFAFCIKIILQDMFDILARIQYDINNFNKINANAIIGYFNNVL